MDFNTLLKHLLWIISLILILTAIFHYVLEAIDYSSFLLSIILTASVLASIGILLIWNAIKTTRQTKQP